MISHSTQDKPLKSKSPDIPVKTEFLNISWFFQ